MHKIFAKPLFLGKRLEFLPECHSTNDELLKIVKEEQPEEGTIVFTDYQIRGKGQRGNLWLSEPKKNILMSLLLKPKFLPLSKQYLLNIVVGLAVAKTVANYVERRKVRLKWPNDIHVGDKKIGGILIENILKKQLLEFSVVGIGLNSNQSGFAVPTATSLKLESGYNYSTKELMEDMVLNIEAYYLKLKAGQEGLLLEDYYNSLYRIDIVTDFRDRSGYFKGIIKGIDSIGNLIVEKNGKAISYGIKEIELIS